MSKKISYKGQLPIGVQERIKLSTKKGKIGYKITKFQVMSSTPGVGEVEYVAKIYSKSQTGSESATVNFTEGDLMAALYYQDQPATAYPSATDVIFDNAVTNQDIFIYIMDAEGGTIPANYYIELETMPLSDVETTQLTLKSLRNIASR